MTTSLIDAKAFRSEIVNEVTTRVSGAVAQAIRDGLAGVQVNVAAPRVEVAAPQVTVAAPSVNAEGPYIDMADLAKEMASIRQLLTQLIAVLQTPVTKTIARDPNNEIKAITESRS